MPSVRPLQPPIRWGILGCGNVTERKSGPAFQQATGSALVAVMRRTPGAAADYARRHGVARWYEDADALIADPDVEAVYVATPPGSHLALALRVAEAGKPCYVEKPIARSAEEADALVEAFARRGLPLFVAYYRRVWPRFRFVREVVESGRLGTLTSVEAVYARPMHPDDPAALPWRLRAEESGGGLFMDLASHTLDVLDFVLGPLSDVSGLAARGAAAYDVEQAVAMAFRAGGAVGVGRWNFGGFASEDRITLTGTRGRVSTSTFGDEPVRLETETGVEDIPFVRPDPVQGPLVQTMVDDLLGRGACPSTGVSAARTAHAMDRVLAGYYGTRRGAFWRDPAAWPGRVGG